MIVKLLGLLDLIAAAAVVFVQIGFTQPNILYFFAVYLGFKGIIFIKSASSILDIVCALYIVFMIFGLKFFLAYLIAIYLFQKGVLSLA